MRSNRFSAWTNLGVLTAILLGATLVVGIGMAAVMHAAPGPEQGPSMFFIYTAQFTLAIAGGILWLRHGGGGRLRFGASWSDGPMILGGILLVTAAGVVIEPAINAFPDRYLEHLDELIGRGGWAILMTVVAAPVLEEIFFRGLLLDSLARRWSGRAAVVASAAIFGLVHAPILPQMVNAFVMAVVMGYIYLQTRSLIPVTVIHAINNGLAYLALEFTGSQGTDTRELIANDAVYWAVYAASAAILVVSLVLLDRTTRTKNREIALNEKTTDE